DGPGRRELRGRGAEQEVDVLVAHPAGRAALVARPGDVIPRAAVLAKRVARAGVIELHRARAGSIVGTGDLSVGFDIGGRGGTRASALVAEDPHVGARRQRRRLVAGWELGELVGIGTGLQIVEVREDEFELLALELGREQARSG